MPVTNLVANLCVRSRWLISATRFGEHLFHYFLDATALPIFMVAFLIQFTDMRAAALCNFTISVRDWCKDPCDL